MGQRSPGNTIGFCLLGALTGGLLIVAPVISRTHPLSVFRLASQAIEHLSFFVLVMLFVAGLVWGLLLKRFEAYATAFSQPALLPLIAIAQMTQDPTSHNLWPLEFMIYAFMGGVGAAGAAVGLLIKRTFTNLPAR